MSRDNQRNRVYCWERLVLPRPGPQWRQIDEVAEWAKPIWRAERGRYGLAKAPMPAIVSSGWGQRSATAHGSYRIELPRWARQPYTVLHEMAHCLTSRNEAHGPRFVGVLIGLLARHAGLDADKLMAAADEMGVKYHVRSIGAVPVFPWWKRLEPLLPCTEMRAAVELGVSYLVVRGAALQLIRRGKARWRGKTLVATGGAV